MVVARGDGEGGMGSYWAMGIVFVLQGSQSAGDLLHNTVNTLNNTELYP